MGVIGTDIVLAAQLLRQNKCVAIPTETVYGLAANALNEDAVAKIFAIKRRPAFDPLIVHIAEMDQMLDFVVSVPPLAMELGRAFWPGPLTLLLPKKEIIPDITTSGLNSVGIRIPSHRMTRELLLQLAFPLAAPSANPFGYISPTSAIHVAAQLGEEVDYILDGGDCAIGLESTIVDCTGEEPMVRRWGGITAEMLSPILGKVRADHTSHSHPQAPGMMLAHYAPKIPMIVGNRNELISQANLKKCATLSFTEPWPSERNLILTVKGDLQEAAKNLFRYMRELDSMSNIQCIYAEWVPQEGIGVAINDKLKRASHR